MNNALPDGRATASPTGSPVVSSPFPHKWEGPEWLLDRPPLSALLHLIAHLRDFRLAAN